MVPPMKRVTGLLLAVMLALVAQSTTAAAQSTGPAPLDTAYCTERYSSVPGISLDDQRLASEIDRLEQLGYNARVVMLDQVTTRGTPARQNNAQDEKELTAAAYAFTEGLVEECDDLRAGPEKDPKLILMVVGVNERFTYFNWGEDLNQWLGTFENPKIQFALDASGAEFRRSDFPGGAAAALDKIHGKITYVSPWSLIPWGKIFMAIGAIALLGLMAWGVASILRRRRERAEHIEAVNAVADRVNTSYYNLTVRLDESDPTNVDNVPFKVRSLERRLAESEITPLKVRLATALEAMPHAGISELSLIQARAASDARDQGALRKLENVASSLDDQLDSIRNNITLLEAKMSELSEQLRQLPEYAERSEDRRDDALTAVQTAKEAGFFTSVMEKRLTGADVELAKAVKAASTGEVSSSIASYQLANRVYAEVADTATKLTERRDSLNERTNKLNAMLEVRTSQVNRGREVFRRLSSEYNPETWRTVSGNGAESDKRLESTRVNLGLVRSQLDMAVQEFDEAEVNLDQIDVWLSEVDSYMRSMSKLLEELDETRESIEGQFQEVRDELTVTRNYVSQNRETLQRGNIDELIRSLDGQSAILDQIDSGLQEELPHYLDLGRKLNKVDKDLDELTEDLTEVYDRVRSTERRVKSLIDSSKTRFNRADQYIEDHRSDVDDDARRELQRARNAHDRAVADHRSGLSVSQMVVLIDLLDSAEDAADKAQSLAESDFSSAEDARDRAARLRRQRNSTSYSSSSSSSSGSWGSIGGGGGSSFGSFGGGGGGSFGGGGGGGGGSW